MHAARVFKRVLLWCFCPGLCPHETEEDKTFIGSCGHEPRRSLKTRLPKFLKLRKSWGCLLLPKNVVVIFDNQLDEIFGHGLGLYTQEYLDFCG